MNNKLSFDQFVEVVASNIKEFLPEEYREAEVIIQKVTKQNDIVLTALSVRKQGQDICPNFYLDSFYQKYLMSNNTFVDLTDIANGYCKMDRQIDFSIESLTPQYIRENVVMRVVGKDRNQSLIKRAPVREYNNMLITLRILTEKKNEHIGSMLITNNTLDIIGELTIDELFSCAEVNTPRLFPATVMSMEEILADMFPPEMRELYSTEVPKNQEGMIVISNDIGVNGATSILYKGVLKNLSSQYSDRRLYVLPSSVHEVICVPCNENVSANELRQMVTEVNCTQVAEDEVLTDSVYLYDPKTDRLEIA